MALQIATTRSGTGLQYDLSLTDDLFVTQGTQVTSTDTYAVKTAANAQ